MYFSDRRRLAEGYDEWRIKNGAADCALNVVTYIDSIGLLKESAAEEQGAPAVQQATAQSDAMPQK